MFAYTLLDGHNDSAEDAAHLAALCTAFTQAHGVRPRLSLCTFNAADGLRFRRSPRLEAFRQQLQAHGLGSIVRYSGGSDVGAACGQLACGSRRAQRAPASG